ncbi:ABC transporter ATP-binding protein [Methanolobus bombayensis]|uniref:ABC transporter ATP-binding protein n=1 Tax=Methanolobus bombayensis TaxID=38023 RepID=UPI001AE6D890|nr:ABC transporter ATP-binding protein [Methanolobus bombayensis]MBP1909434.1 branched-chain amino acid transport system ATP-binding protein [Methanolobus bombayensis]
MLDIKDLHSGYGELRVLKGIDIEVGENEIVALIGPNGAGKSTVIKSVFNISDVTSGNITFKGQDITSLKTHEIIKLGISYLNQGKINFTNLTVRENLTIGADQIFDPGTVQDGLEKVYTKFPDLKTKENELAYTLSGGQQQMLALGRSLMQRPSLLLMDEPSLGLSPKLQQELFATIASLRDEGISMLIVEQNAKKAIELADRTYLLEDGNVVLEGGKEILENEAIRNVYLGGRY